MKTKIFLYTVLIMIVSCSSENTGQVADRNVIDSVKNPADVHQNMSFDVEKLPVDWVKLTNVDGKWVIYNSCDAGNLLMSISKNKSKFNLLLHGTQEDDEYEVLDGRQFKDTIFLETKGLSGNNKQIFKLLWINQQKGLARWITTHSSGYTSNEMFTVKDKMGNYETIVQSCVECWGDECDEAK